MAENTGRTDTGFDDMLNVDAVFQDDKVASFVAESGYNRERCYEMSKEMTERISADADKFREYLDLQSRFERYTANNVLLIMAQKPEARRIGDYGYWRSQGAYVERGEAGKPILIMEPGKEYEREDGTIGTYYNAKKKYDISQTTLRRKIMPAETGEKAEDKTLIQALVYHPPVRIIIAEPEQLPEGKGALFVPEKKCIFVRKGMNARNIFRSVAFELCHAELAGSCPDYDRKAYVFHAYSASYMLGKKYGMDVDNYDFSAVPDIFEGMEPPRIRAELNKIREAFGAVSTRMSRSLSENQRQKPRQDRGEVR